MMGSKRTGPEGAEGDGYDNTKEQDAPDGVLCGNALLMLVQAHVQDRRDVGQLQRHELMM